MFRRITPLLLLLTALGTLASCTGTDPTPTSTSVPAAFTIIVADDGDQNCAVDENGVSPCDATAEPIGTDVLIAGSSDVSVPGFSLPSASSDLVEMSSYSGKQPFVVVFYRGFF